MHITCQCLILAVACLHVELSTSEQFSKNPKHTRTLARTHTHTFFPLRTMITLCGCGYAFQFPRSPYSEITKLIIIIYIGISIVTARCHNSVWFNYALV